MHEENRKTKKNNGIASQRKARISKPMTVALSGMLTVTMMGMAPFQALADNMTFDSASAADVIAAIESLPAPSQITADSAEQVESALRLYNELSDSDRGLIDKDLVDKLDACASAVSVPSPEGESGDAGEPAGEGQDGDEGGTGSGDDQNQNGEAGSGSQQPGGDETGDGNSEKPDEDAGDQDQQQTKPGEDAGTGTTTPDAPGASGKDDGNVTDPSSPKEPVADPSTSIEEDDELPNAIDPKANGKPVEQIYENPKKDSGNKQQKPQDENGSNSETYQTEYPSQDYTQIHYTRNLTTETFIASIGDSARVICQEKNLYASVMIAQAVLESGSGNSGLAQAPNNNLFGIKGSYKGKSVNMLTSEDDGSGSYYNVNANFRKYDTLMESLEDYGDLLRAYPQYYAAAWKENAKDYKAAAYALQGTYASSTNYAESLIKIIDAYDLTRFDQKYSWRVDGKILDKESPEADASGYRPMTMMDYARLEGTAISFIGTPYVWGGTTPNGFDCSGFVQYLYKTQLGIDLPRTTYVQQHCGVEVAFKDLRMGDLLFFNDSESGTHHVAMYLSDGYYIHAPQTGDVIRIGSFDTYKPSFAKRIINMVDIDEQGYPAHTASRVKHLLQTSTNWNELFVARKEDTEPIHAKISEPTGTVSGKVTSAIIDKGGKVSVKLSESITPSTTSSLTIGQVMELSDSMTPQTTTSLTIGQALDMF